MDEIESLEQQLQSLPRAAAPDGLLQRLLADIPDQPAFASRSQSRRTKMALASVAAALCISASVAVYNRLHPTPTADRERAVSAEYALFRPIPIQETDPCSILPPLPAS